MLILSIKSLKLLRFKYFYTYLCPHEFKTPVIHASQLVSLLAGMLYKPIEKCCSPSLVLL